MSERRSLRNLLLNNWPAKVLSLLAAVLLAVFHNLSDVETRVVTLPLDVELPSDLVNSQELPLKARLNMRGSSDRLYSLEEESLRAFVDLRNYDREGTVRELIRWEYIGDNDRLDGLEISSDPGAIDIPLERSLIKSVPLVARTVGSPADGYEIDGISLSPQNIEIRGPRSLIDSIESIATETISVDGRSESLSLTVEVSSPNPLVHIIGQPIIEASVQLDQRVGVRTLEQIPLVLELASNMVMSQDLPLGSAIIRAGVVDLERLPRDALEFRPLDLEGPLGLGQYDIQWALAVPPGYEVLSLVPNRSTVVVEEAPETAMDEGSDQRAFDGESQ